MAREYILRKCLANIVESEMYDYILIDAPPTLGGWVMNILCASNKIVIRWSRHRGGCSVSAICLSFSSRCGRSAPELELGGLVITKVDTRKSYFKQTLETLKELEDVRVFDTYIRVDSGILKSGRRIITRRSMAYKKSSRSAAEYMELAKEIAQIAGV